MSEPTANPTRLSCLPDSDDSLGVGRMFRSARELPDEELPRLRWRLRTSQRLRAMRPRLFVRIAIVVGIVFCMGGVVGAVVSPLIAKKEPIAVVPRDPAATPVPKPPRKPRRAASLSPPSATSSEPIPGEPLPVTDEPAPSATQPVPEPPELPSVPSKRHRPARVAMLDQPIVPPAPIPLPAVAPPPAEPSRIDLEQALLSQAMKSLREQRDARAALAQLGQHAERFPDGVFAWEATMVRVESLLALARRDEALAVLDGMALASLPRRDEALVVRGELRAAAGRWPGARQDFDDALRERALPAALAKTRGLQERALWGRASARSRLGDESGARADLELYLRHFPDGRFAVPAASLLKGVP